MRAFAEVGGGGEAVLGGDGVVEVSHGEGNIGCGVLKINCVGWI